MESRRDAAARSDEAPLLSIGLAVYNGARYLRTSLESLLAQDVGDLEVVISDNASTDETPRICEEYARRDPRVRYSRNDMNMGAAANFNKVFRESRGRYFMWGSDDDIWDPRFAAACIASLEADPDAVMCTSRVRLIDEEGRERDGDWYRSLDTRGMSVEGRVHELVRQRSWYGMYSVFRPEALERTGLYHPTFGGDVHLLLELLLLGDALTVPEDLFRYRLPLNSKSAFDHLREIHGTAVIEGTQSVRPWSALVASLFELVRDSGLDDETSHRIRDDMVETLSMENWSWGNAILGEYAGVGPTDTPLPPPLLRVAVEAALDGKDAPSGAAIDAWRLHERTRLRGVRGFLLRILQPFTERQRRLDALQTTALALLADEVRGSREETRGARSV